MELKYEMIPPGHPIEASPLWHRACQMSRNTDHPRRQRVNLFHCFPNQTLADYLLGISTQGTLHMDCAMFVQLMLLLETGQSKNNQFRIVAGGLCPTLDLKEHRHRLWYLTCQRDPRYAAYIEQGLMDKGQWLLSCSLQGDDEPEEFVGLSRAGVVTQPLTWWKADLLRRVSPLTNTAWQMLQC